MLRLRSARSMLGPFLGFIISVERICVDPAKVRVVSDWPTPEGFAVILRFWSFLFADLCRIIDRSLHP